MNRYRNINEENYKIAEYTGCFEKLYESGYCPKAVFVDDEQKNPYVELAYDNYWRGTSAILQFHKSWDWLMPVIEKIESSGRGEDEFDIFGNCVQLGNEEFVGKTKIEAAWHAVIWWIDNNYIKKERNETRTN